jgi:hypothetical protein
VGALSNAKELKRLAAALTENESSGDAQRRERIAHNSFEILAVSSKMELSATP